MLTLKEIYSVFCKDISHFFRKLERADLGSQLGGREMMKSAVGLLGVIGICLILACAREGNGLMKGTIKYVDLEGGFYGIVDDAGTKFDPVNLPKDFQSDGIRVTFRATAVQNQMSLRMWGKPVKLETIERVG